MNIGSGKIGYDRPPAAAGVCQHHGAAYAESVIPSGILDNPKVKRDNIADGATIVSVAITITERCCIAVSSALLVWNIVLPTAFEIERPVNTIRTTQEDYLRNYNMHIIHHGAWEVLDPGAYTYSLVNRAGVTTEVNGAWIKAIASDCLG